MDTWININYPFGITETVQQFGSAHFDRLWNGKEVHKCPCSTFKQYVVGARKEESDKNNDSQTVPSSKTNQFFEESKHNIFQSSSSNSIRYSLILVADQPEITQ